MHIRTAKLGDEAAISQVKITTWRATYAGLLPQSLLDQMSLEDNTQNFHQMLHHPGLGSFIFVAEDETGQIVGYAAGGPDREDNPQFRGEIYALYVLPGGQHHGIGRRLLQACARQLFVAGITTMQIWVLAENPARFFYEAMGGRFLREVENDFGGVCKKIAAYGWEDTHFLAFAY
jgi:ribosomal protein S18 acetylase RimI-like enzyme